MRLPSFKQLRKTDFKTEYQDLIETLSLSVNNAIESLNDLANKKISLTDNVACTVKDVLVIVDSSGAPTTNTAIALDSTNKVLGTSIILVTNQTNSNTYPTNAPFISYQAAEKSIIIRNITGLQAGQKWLLRVIVWQS